MGLEGDKDDGRGDKETSQTGVGAGGQGRVNNSSIPISPFPFPLSHFPFPISPFPFPIPHSPFPIPYAQCRVPKQQ